MATLQDSITINGLRLRNRLVLPALTNFYGTTEGEVTDASLGFYRQRARHVGLVVVEATAVRPDGRIGPRSLGLWSDAQIAGMARLAGAIKAEGAAAVVQLNHAGARAVPVDGGISGASPSGIAFRPDAQPTVLNEEQIDQIKDAFVSAAVRAREAGFGGVEVHGAHLYLLSQFLSPITNKRQDRYGGDAEARATFALEVVRGIRQAAGPDFAVLIRINAAEAAEGGQTPEDAARVARLLQGAGADTIDASLVATGAWVEIDGKVYFQAKSALAKEQSRGEALPFMVEVKKAVSIPVIGVGKLSGPETRSAVGEGVVDMVAIGRQMIADPDAAGKILDSRDQDVVLCRECWGCFGCTAKGIPLVCSVNRNVTGEPEFSKLAQTQG